jgi:hypothetical protein
MTKAIVRDPIYRHRRFQSETIELCVRWYLTYRLSYRDLVEVIRVQPDGFGGLFRAFWETPKTRPLKWPDISGKWLSERLR